MNMKKNIHVYYKGRVQGVGFRYIARDVAGELGVAGWVKNLPDSRVEVSAEAEEEVLEEFLSRINRHFSHYIQDIDINWQPETGGLRDFRIEL